MLERVPPRTARSLRGEIVPHNVDLAVAGQKFAHLRVHIVDILREIAPLVYLGEILLCHLLAAGIPVILCVMRMMPVKKRIIEAALYAGLVTGVGEFLDDVAAARRLGRFVIRVFRIKKTESFMMLGREHDVLHAGVLRRANPLFRVKEIGIEIVHIRLILGVGYVLVVLYPLVAGGQRIGSEMNEHSESRIGEPFEPRSLLGLRLGQPGKRHHRRQRKNQSLHFFFFPFVLFVESRTTSCAGNSISLAGSSGFSIRSKSRPNAAPPILSRD